MVIFATLMNRIDRLNALRILLESRRLITAQEIADHFGLSLRTVYRDIRSLQEAGIEVEGEAGMGYRLSRQAHLRPVSFQSVEALSLLLAAKVVERHMDAYHTSVFENAIRKIRAALPLQEKDQLERLENKIALPSFGIPRNGVLDPEALHPIQHALLQGSLLQIDYHTYARETSAIRKVVPIGILYYAGYWHMIAWCLLRSEYRDFRVDRILKLDDLGPHTLKKKLLSLEQYLEQMSHLHGSSGNKPAQTLTECVIHFSPSLYSLFEKTRFRFGFVRQQTVESENRKGWTAATFYFDNLDELARWLLSFTTAAHIVSPPQLAAIYQEHLRELHTLP